MRSMAMKAGRRSQSERMQRVQAGVTGLAAVLVLGGLAGALFNSTRDAPAAGTIDSQVAQVTGNTATAVEKSVSEPLAELGVAPAPLENETQTAAP